MNDTIANARGLALARAAEAMLRALGGETVSLIFPMPGASDANTVGLGLSAVAAEDVSISPVVMRPLANDSGRARREFLFAAAPVYAQAELRAIGSAEDLFQSALGILHQGRLMHIESVTPELFGGSAYLYRVVAVE